MTSDLDDAIRDYEVDVKHEAAKLVRQGVSPWVAIDRAVDVVKTKRKSSPCKSELNFND